MNLKFKMKNFIISLAMMFGLLFQPMTTLAQATYSCGTYGSNAYATNTCDSGSTKTSLWGRLSNTGMDALPYILAGLLLFAGSATLFKMARKNAKQH
ncbi:hypothetical protein KBD20_02130 [Candidatus Saccharibacteria bacterium]|nr:hypothetical protein [Candidatus Saccharibacteria bacterium]